MEQLYIRFPKDKIKYLPVEKFVGRVYVILNEEEAQKAVNFLLTESLLGIDTESRPVFKKGQQTKVALLQVATQEACFLFRLNRIGISKSICSLLNSDVLKIGLSLKDDIMRLNTMHKVCCKNLVDLQVLIPEVLGIQDKALQKIYANMFGKKLSKAQRLTNWEADVLNDQQLNYAALDAWACLKIYEKTLFLQQSKNYQLISSE